MLAEKNSNEIMEKALVPMYTNELYITYAESQGCFIKIWANFNYKKGENLDRSLQDYKNYTVEFTRLDLYGNTLYVYIWSTDINVKVYRCQVLCSDLVKKTHTIVLIDYGRKMVVPYSDVREISRDIDQSFLMSLSQRAAVNTFLLSGYLSKPKSNNELVNILCNKYYKYRRDFDVGGITFVSLYDVDDRLIEHNVVKAIDTATMITIANSMASVIAVNNKNDVVYSCPIPSKTSSFLLRGQNLDYFTLIDITVTRVSMDNNSIILTVQTLDNDSEALNSVLNSLDRQNLKLAPVLEVYTPCLIVVRNKLVRAIILEVTVDRLYIDLVDYGVRESVPRTAVFEIPSNCNLIEMRSLNVVLDKPNDLTIDKSTFIEKYFQMLPLKMDPSFGLYKVKLFKKINEDIIDVCSLLNSVDVRTNKELMMPSKLPELFSITEINEETKSIENSLMANCLNNHQIEKENMEQNENKSAELKEQEIEELKVQENLELKVIELTNHKTPITFLMKENLMDCQEILGLIINYKSPFNFRVRQYNPDFESFIHCIKSSLDSRYILKKFELENNMYIIYQNQSDSIYRAQVKDMDSNVEKIKLQLVDEGDEIIIESFEEIVLYNFVESDCNIPGQLVLDCSLSNMWFPVMNADTTLILQPYFNSEILYNIEIVKTDESGIKLVNLVEKETNIEISDTILKSGIGQRLSAAMKTDENPYEESLFKSQSFLSYVYHYHFKLYIQPEPHTVDELEEEISEYIKENSDQNPESLEDKYLQGIYCLATVDNDQWYRACIKSINEESFIVYMFDIGLLTDVSLKQIRPITSSLMRKPQLCLFCILENKDFAINITKNTLFNITVKSINDNGELIVFIKEHNHAPLSNPIVRGVEQISFVHVDGDLTYLQRSQDILKIEKMSATLSKLNSTLECKMSSLPHLVHIFESHGKYYRCVVKTVNSKMAVVHCIDFGFEKQVEKKRLKCLGNSKIALLPALVITVKTFPMAFNMSKTMFLANMGVEEDGTLYAMPNKPSLVHSDNKLMEMLKNGCLVKVTCVDSNNECWIVPHMSFDSLKTISDKLVKMQSKVSVAVTEIGSLCAALHSETKEWHRGLVLSEGKETENILSIDTGIRFKALKTSKLTSEIQKIPNFALHCRVNSNIDIKIFLNKDVKCKLISCVQPLIEVELFSDHKDETKITSTPSIMEWTVCVYRFESLKEFYVKKIDDKYGIDSANANQFKNSVADKFNDFIQQPPVGAIVAALTDKGDGLWYKAEVLASHNKMSAIIRLLNDGSICKSTKLKSLPSDKHSEKLYYRCCLAEDIEDDNINDPKNISVISEIIMMSEWTMETLSEREPYKVTLTNQGKDFIDILYSSFSTDNNDSQNSMLLEEKNISMKNVENHNAKSLVETPKNNIARENCIKNNLILPDFEIVTIKNMDTYQYFYAHSDSISMLYLQRINSDLDVSIIELTLNNKMIGSVVVTSSQSLNCWCRAKVEKILSDSTSAYCYLMDFGIYENCSEFYKPTEFLCICPPIVRRCSLYSPRLVGKENEIWFSNINDMFRDIITINSVKFNMVVLENKDPCLVTLKLEDSNVSDMLYPITVELTYVNSLVDFKIRALSTDQKAVMDTLERGKFSMILEKTPIMGNLYLTKINSKIKRVKFDALDGIMYVVVDIDDTLDVLIVDSLYEVPENIRNIPIFTMFCSLILKNNEDQYSSNIFQTLASQKLTFTMCIVTESDSDKNPNLVRLYLNNKDILDFLKLES